MIVSMVMSLIVAATIALGIWMSGVGGAPYFVPDAIILIIIAPAAMTMIGTAPHDFFGAFRIAFRPAPADRAELVAARATIRGYGRVIVIAGLLYATIGFIAMLVGIGPDADEHLWSLGPGVATAIIMFFYALIAHTMVIQPLVIRLERAIAPLSVP